MKQEIKSLGLKNGSFKKSLQFVKMLSTCKNIDTFLKESESLLGKRKGDKLKIEDLRQIMRKKFYNQLSDHCTNSILADLLITPASKKGKKKLEKPVLKVEE